MRRSLGIVVATALVASTAVALAPDYGLKPAVETMVLLIVLGGAALAAAHFAARRRRLLGRLRGQFSIGVAIAVGQMLVAVVAIAALMFVSHENAVMIAALVGFTGVIAVRAAQLVAGHVLRDIEAVRDGLIGVGRGERSPTIKTGSRDELAELAREANAMIERLAAEESARDAAEAARRDLVVAVSHDLRTPITSLRLLAEAVGDDIVDADTRRRYLDTMTTHIHALGALIDDLFELSRLEAGDIQWSVERVALNELVDETVAAMRVQAEAKRVAVVADIAADLAPARANPEKVQRVLFNLIQNAIRHTPADGSVTVRAEPSAQTLHIEVSDTGTGIARADYAKVFEPFFRGGSEAARTRNGAGLGLAISRAIVEAQGGRIWLEAGVDEGTGTRVRFSLPRAV